MIATYYVFVLSLILSSGIDQGERANQKYVLYNVCFFIVKSSLICSTVVKMPPVRKVLYSNVAEIKLQLQPTAVLR